MLGTLAAVLAVLTACSGRPAPTGPPSPVTARLDWSSAAIELPLHAFGMSPAESRQVRAAFSIKFAQCVSGAVSVTPAVLDEARAALQPPVPDPDATHWLYGVWDRPFVLKHGWRPFPPGGTRPQLVPAGKATGQRCAAGPDLVDLDPIDTSTTTPGTDLLSRLALESFDLTTKTPAYATLTNDLASCIEKAGYDAVPATDGGGVKTDVAWSESRTAAAMVVEAGCNDSLGLTQRLADIDAGNESGLIAQHHSELLALRSEAENRLRKAKDVLHGVGVDPG